MAQPINCDSDCGLPGAFLITNLADGDTIALCPGHLVTWCQAMVDAADRPHWVEPAPQPQADGAGPGEGEAAPDPPRRKRRREEALSASEPLTSEASPFRDLPSDDS